MVDGLHIPICIRIMITFTVLEVVWGGDKEKRL
jgi:hypothetical protein